jgi:hypothetical protein
MPAKSQGGSHAGGIYYSALIFLVVIEIRTKTTRNSIFSLPFVGAYYKPLS